MTDIQNTPPQSPETENKQREDSDTCAQDDSSPPFDADFYDPLLTHTPTYDLTASSLSSCYQQTFGDAHPAADLEKMGKNLMDILIDDADGECVLRREAQVLDGLFHTLITKALKQKGEPDQQLIALALRAQKQAEETIGRADLKPYQRTMVEYLTSKQEEMFHKKLQRRAERYPQFDDSFSKQTGLGKNDN